MGDQSNSNGLIARVSAWAAKPFTEEMDIWHWSLLVVFLASVTILWIMILKAIKDGLSEG